jgi:SH3 domain-containing YSC84-like protein 1
MKKLLLAALCLLVALPALAQSKVDKRLSDSTAVLNTLLTKPDGINKSLLAKSECILVYPAVRKVAVGIGGTYGRGVLVCRTGKAMDGHWGAPIMYTLDTGSLGVQLGTTSTDYVMLVMTQRGADKILSGKLKLGADASAAAGPNAAQAAGFNDPNIDILTYSEAKGLFAGAALGSASMAADDDANEKLYGKPIDAMEIVRGDAAVPASGKPLVDLLNQTAEKHM